MKAIVFKLAKITLKFKLKILWLPIYHFFNFLIVHSIQSEHIKIWSRNSFVSGALTPPLSDLDYTIIYDATFVTQSEIFRKINLLKKIVPLFKEANVYEKQFFPKIKKFINPYELKRDPFLERFLINQKLELEKPQKTHAVVFILKAFEHDFNYLSNHPEIRMKRWENLLSLINNKAILTNQLQRDLSQIISQMVEIENSSLDLLGFIQSNFDFRHPHSELFSILFPVKYIIHCFDTHIPLKLPLNNLNDFQQEILLAIFKWEVSGLLSQAYLTQDYHHYFEHLSNLHRLLSTGLNSKNLEEIENSLKVFSELLYGNYERSI